MQELHNNDLPGFIIKSTFGVSIVGALILIPFAIISFFHSRFLLSLLLLMILVLCSINIWAGLKNKYINSVNILGIFLLTVVSAAALYVIQVDGSYWSSLIVLSPYFILPKRQAWVANIFFIIAISPIALNVLEPSTALRFYAVLLGISFFAFSSTNEIYKQYYLLNKLSITDNLTGLYNRSLLQHSLEKAIYQNDRSGLNMAIFMLDIDHFKIINDQFGHDIGDSVLKDTGEFLNAFFRGSDIVFRVGGEEFLVLIYNINEANTVDVANKLRKKFELLPLISNHVVTMSIGVSNLKQNMAWEQWMKQGDENLYKAKSNGRNQVVT